MEAPKKKEKSTVAPVVSETKIRRRITNLDDQRFWAEFETEEIGRILSGEIKPKTLITTSLADSTIKNAKTEVQMGRIIAKELLSVFPNSTYCKIGPGFNIFEVEHIAKTKGFTTLVVVDTIRVGAQLCITSLVNGVTATFELFNIRHGVKIDDKNPGNPKSRPYPQIHMGKFTSPMGAVVGRMIQSIFPKVRPSRRGPLALFVNHNDYILFRQYSSADSDQVCGLRFSLMLTSLLNKEFEWVLETSRPEKALL